MKKLLIISIIFCISFLCFLQVLSKNQKSLEAGLPKDIEGYSKWTKLNKKIIKPREQDPHRGFKRIYINRLQEELRDQNKNLIFPYPEETIVVKEVHVSRSERSKINLISIMRKLPGNETTGGWDFIEYTRSSSDNSFIPLQLSKESCYACHQGAQESDFVWTKFDNFRRKK